jgi:high affinity sulfate transporter 1
MKLRIWSGAGLRADVVGGLALAAFAIPESMAYASLAGLPPQAGLYGYLVAGPAFALITSGRHVAVGPTSSLSIIVAATLAGMAAGDPVRYGALAAATALLVALMALASWILRLEQFVHFISEPILIGFKAGVALVIASSQLFHLVGIPSHGSGFFSRMWYLAGNLGSVHLPSALVGLGALAAILLLEKRLTGGIVVLSTVVISIALSAWLGLAAFGVKVAHEVPRGLPVPALPRFSVDDVDSLAALAVACFLLAFIETIATARTFAMKHRYTVNPRREMLALAAANAAAGLFRGYPVSGGMSQSAVNEQGGAQSARSLVFTAAAVAIVLLFLTGPFRYLPEPTLAALVLAAVSGLVERRIFRHLRAVSPLEFRSAIVAFSGVLVFGILRGVILAVVVSLGMVIVRTARVSASLRGRVPGQAEFVDLANNPDARPIQGVLVYRPDEGLVYFNADHVRDDVLARVRAAEPRPAAVVMDLSRSGSLDLTSVNMICELEQELGRIGSDFRLAEVHTEARRRLQAEGLVDRFGGVTERQAVGIVVEANAQRRPPEHREPDRPVRPES